MTRSPENIPVVAVCPEVQRGGEKWAGDARNFMLRSKSCLHLAQWEKVCS